jgi:uncharacterized phage protein gp47/JayE
MADILKVYTAEQLYEMCRLKLIADGVGLTDFNEGSKVRSLIESVVEIISAIQMDHKEAIAKAIPIALYQGFGFSLLGETKSIGYIRPYRRPALWIRYTGAGTSALITSTPLIISSAVVGAPGDAFSFDYATYPTISALVTAIDGLANWEATLVQNLASNLLYQYTAKEAVGSTNYENTAGLDLMLAPALAISILPGYSITIDNMQIVSTLAATIAEGESGVQCLSQNQSAGAVGNIIINAVDTINGKGYINSQISGVEQVINDSAFSGGAAAETDAERKTRFSTTVTALNAGTKSGIEAAIRGITGVRSVGMRTSYPFKGTNTILVDDGSGVISPTLLAAVEKVLYGDPDDIANYPGKNAEGIGYNISAPTIVAVNIGIAAQRFPSINVDLTEIKNAIQTAIEQYVNTRQLGENVLISELIRVGKNASAAIYDIVITSPLSNVVIDDDEFAKTGAGTGGTVTVVVTVATSI